MPHAHGSPHSAGEDITTSTVHALWRYPVKSMGGQQLVTATVVAGGLRGDRIFAMFDELSGQIMTLRSAPQLLYARAALEKNPAGTSENVTVTFPGGESATAPGASRTASVWLRRGVKLATWEGRRQAFTGSDYFDYGFELEYDSTSNFGDTPGAIHITSTGTLNWLATQGFTVDERRLRPNIVLDLGPDPFMEDKLLGKDVVIGAVRLSCVQSTERCSLLDASQPGLEKADGLRDRVLRGREGNLGIYAQVSLPGRISVGDTVEIAGPSC
jgi:uncharacterized protein YcbX